MPLPTTKKTTGLATLVVAVEGDALRDQVQGFLSGLGFLVIGAVTLADACRIAVREDVHLLITDEPVHRAEWASSNRENLKVLLISGGPEYVNRAPISAPAISFIEKPFAWCELKRKVLGLLADHTRSCSDAAGAA